MQKREGTVAAPVKVALDSVVLDGDLTVPTRSKSIVLFAHGSGSSRLSPRNRFVAGVLNEAGLGTLLLDLLTRAEEAIDMQTAHLRFDIDFLAGRLLEATRWVEGQPELRDRRIGYFGASTGAAAALIAAAQEPDKIGSVVSRGGRPDLAEGVLDRVRAPTLLIVGGADYPVITMNRSALQKLGGIKSLVIVPGATHLFEEPGALESVASLAAGWFKEYLSGGPETA